MHGGWTSDKWTRCDLIRCSLQEWLRGGKRHELERFIKGKFKTGASKFDSQSKSESVYSNGSTFFIQMQLIKMADRKIAEISEETAEVVNATVNDESPSLPVPWMFTNKKTKKTVTWLPKWVPLVEHSAVSGCFSVHYRSKVLTQKSCDNSHR